MPCSSLVYCGTDFQLAEPGCGQRVLAGGRFSQVLVHFGGSRLGGFHICVRNSLPTVLGGTPKCKMIFLCAKRLPRCGRRNHIVYIDFVAGIVGRRRDRGILRRLRVGREGKGRDSCGHQGNLQVFMHTGQSSCRRKNTSALPSRNLTENSYQSAPSIGSMKKRNNYPKGN